MPLSSQRARIGPAVLNTLGSRKVGQKAAALSSTTTTTTTTSWTPTVHRPAPSHGTVPGSRTGRAAVQTADGMRGRGDVGEHCLIPPDHLSLQRSVTFGESTRFPRAIAPQLVPCSMFQHLVFSPLQPCLWHARAAIKGSSSLSRVDFSIPSGYGYGHEHHQAASSSITRPEPHVDPDQLGSYWS